MLRRFRANDLDEGAIDALLQAGDTVVAQIDVAHEGAEALPRVERACARHDARFEVRFYGEAVFDGRWLRAIPSARAIRIDCSGAEHLEELASLERLESFALHADRSPPDALASANLARVTALGVTAPRGGIDLAPLRRMPRLARLSLVGFGREAAVAGDVASLEELSLTRASHHLPLDFVARLPRLARLAITFGSREHLDDLRAPALEGLLLLRVRGLRAVAPSRFPRLARFAIEDQPHVTALDFGANDAIERVRVSNCRALTQLLGAHDRPHLRELRIARAPIDFDALLARGLPPRLAVASFWTGKRTRDAALRKRLDGLGLASAEQPWVAIP